MDNNISFSKIVATPTLNSWSQAYNAGKLFAVLSLEKTQEVPQDLQSLNMLGKNLLERLEQEFFTIVDKNLESIKTAISNTFQEKTERIKFSFAAGAFTENVLYLFTLGKAKVFIKRGDNFGLVLDSNSNDPSDIISSSGFLKERDLIILSTEAFSEIVTNDDLNSTLSNALPLEITESLAPKIHKAENGKISAIVIKYGNPQVVETLETESKDVIEEVAVEKPTHPFNKYLTLLKSKLKRPNINFNPTKKLFLITAIVIVGILISSIFFAIQKQNNAKVKTLFTQVYSDAQKKYDEGQSLLDLNKNLARDSYMLAQKILTDNKDKFPTKSKENTQVQDLLKKVDDAITLSSAINKVKAKEVSKDVNDILNAGINNPSFNFFAQDSSNIYFANNNSVKTQGKEIIKNDSVWKNIGGLGTYLGNIYLLDKDSKQILKFIPSESGFSKGNYFPENVSPDLSSAKGITIDGSIYVLLADGTIEKFTKGKRDSFTVSGLDKPFSAPSRIFTNLDTDNIYILDNRNSRIVIIDKNGSYKSQYQADILNSAKDFDVLEKDKKIYVLSSQNKTYEIDLK